MRVVGLSLRSLLRSPGVVARPVHRGLRIVPQEGVSRACSPTGYAMGQSPLSRGAVEGGHACAP